MMPSSCSFCVRCIKINTEISQKKGLIFLMSAKSAPELHTIHRMLLSLGATPDSMGFHYTAHAVWLCCRQSGQLYVTKMVYPEVAAYYQTTWMAVERGIRRLITSIWEQNAEKFRLLTGCPLYKRPSPSQFIAVLSLHLSITK